MAKLSWRVILWPLCVFAVDLAMAAPSGTKTCFQGYTLSRNNMCVQEIVEDPKLICSVGELDGRGCRVQLAKVKRCSEGYTLDASGGCSYLVPTDVQYFCPAGYSDNGDACIKSQPGELSTYCDEGAERVNDQCVVMQRAPVVMKTSCPSGAHYEEGKCWKVANTFDCSQECKFMPMPLFCDKKNRQAVSSPLRMLQEASPVENEELLLQTPEHVEGEETVDFDVEENKPGPEDSEPNDDTTDDLSEYILDHGIKAELDDGSLRKLQDAVGTSQEPTHVQEDHDSLNPHLKGLIPASPPRLYQTIVVSQTCARRYEVPPVTQPSCPPNYHMDSVSCFLQEIQPVKTKCAANNGPADTCPRSITSIEKVSRCANGHPAVKGKCFDIVPGEMLSYCPSGYLENSEGLCEGYVEAKSQCPPDLVARAGKCTGKRVRAPIEVDDSMPTPLNTTRVNLKELKEFFHLRMKSSP